MRYETWVTGVSIEDHPVDVFRLALPARESIDNLAILHSPCYSSVPLGSEVSTCLGDSYPRHSHYYLQPKSGRSKHRSTSTATHGGVMSRSWPMTIWRDGKPGVKVCASPKP